MLGTPGWHVRNGQPLVTVQRKQPGRGTISLRCDDADDLEYLSQLASKTLDFPFPIAAAAICARKLGDPRAEEDLAVARELLEKMTLVPGHDPSHEWFLTWVTRVQAKMATDAD